jgi:hypothetical protein
MHKFHFFLHTTRRAAHESTPVDVFNVLTITTTATAATTTVKMLVARIFLTKGEKRGKFIYFAGMF